MDKYEQITVVGEGSYGLVLKCRHRETDQIVAVKKFLETEEDATVRRMALREIRMLKKLRHENLVTMVEVFRHRKRFYLVFEFVEGTVLDELEKMPGGLGEDRTRERIYQVTRAINYCHSNQIIHRDVKPENVLVSSLGVVKLCDFGFARIVGVGSEPCTEYVATRWYRAPELLVGDQHYGPGIDVWAIGCLFAEMMTGDPLFPGESDIDQLYLIVKLIGKPCLKHQQLMIKNSQLRGMLKSSNPNNDLTTTAANSTNIYKTFSNWSLLSLDFLISCIKMDPMVRPQAEELLKHNYFTHDRFPQRFLPALREKVHQEFNSNPLLRRFKNEVLMSTEKKEREEKRRSSQIDPLRWKINLIENNVKRKFSCETLNLNQSQQIQQQQQNQHQQTQTQHNQQQQQQITQKNQFLKSSKTSLSFLNYDEEQERKERRGSKNYDQNVDEDRDEATAEEQEQEREQEEYNNKKEKKQEEDASFYGGVSSSSFVEFLTTKSTQTNHHLQPGQGQGQGQHGHHAHQHASCSSTSLSSSSNVLHPSINNISFGGNFHLQKKSPNNVIQTLNSISLRGTFNQVPLTHHNQHQHQHQTSIPPFSLLKHGNSNKGNNNQRIFLMQDAANSGLGTGTGGGGGGNENNGAGFHLNSVSWLNVGNGNVTNIGGGGGGGRKMMKTKNCGNNNNDFTLPNVPGATGSPSKNKKKNSPDLTTITPDVRVCVNAHHHQNNVSSNNNNHVMKKAKKRKYNFHNYNSGNGGVGNFLTGPAAVADILISSSTSFLINNFANNNNNNNNRRGEDEGGCGGGTGGGGGGLGRGRGGLGGRFIHEC